MALLMWSLVTQPKHDGGLGLKNLQSFSISLLGPSLLKLLNSANVPWVSLVSAKYQKWQLCRPGRVEIQPKISAFWRHCCKAMGLIGRGFSKQIGNGCLTNIYDEPWLFDLPFA